MAKAVRSLGFGSRKGIKGHLHRSHRAAKNQRRLTDSMFYRKLKNRDLSEKNKKAHREILRKEKMWIGDIPKKK